MPMFAAAESARAPFALPQFSRWGSHAEQMTVTDTAENLDSY